MSFTDKELGNELNNQINKGFDIIEISKWAFKVYFNTRELTSSQKNVLGELLRMEDDPQFEYSEQELKLLAEMLIDGEKNPIQKLNNLK